MQSKCSCSRSVRMPSPQMSASHRRARGCSDSRLPGESLSNTTTSIPESVSRSVTCEPMNPAPPVTRTFIYLSFRALSPKCEVLRKRQDISLVRDSGLRTVDHLLPSMQGGQSLDGSQSCDIETPQLVEDRMPRHFKQRQLRA